MKFSDLMFDQAGCCGTHEWAEVRHDTGIRSVVTVVESGWTVAAFSGNTLMHAPIHCNSQADVCKVLRSDATLTI